MAVSNAQLVAPVPCQSTCAAACLQAWEPTVWDSSFSRTVCCSEPVLLQPSPARRCGVEAMPPHPTPPWQPVCQRTVLLRFVAPGMRA